MSQDAEEILYDKVDPSLLSVWRDRNNTEECLSHRHRLGVYLDEEAGGFVRVLIRVYHPPSESIDKFFQESPTAKASRYETWSGRGCTTVNLSIHECAALSRLPDVTRLEISKKYRIPMRGVRGPKRRKSS